MATTRGLHVVAFCIVVAACSSQNASPYTARNGCTVSKSLISGEFESEDRVFFEFDQSRLSTQARATLDLQAAYIAKFPTIGGEIDGNCDERGAEEYNLALDNDVPTP